MFGAIGICSFKKYFSSISPSSKESKPVIELGEKICSFKIMDAYMYERIFVQIIAEIAERRGIPDARLAKYAWPHQKAAATAWRKMRNDNENPKRLNIEEAVLLTQFLGVSMSDVCGMVQGRLMELECAPKPISPREGHVEAEQTLPSSRESLPINFAKVREK